MALDGPGVREVLEDGSNGILLPSDSPAEKFAESLATLFKEEASLHSYAEAARKTAEAYDTSVCAKRDVGSL